MQVDQFESEVESLSVQTRKKKGDKEVSHPISFIQGRLFLQFLSVHIILQSCKRVANFLLS